MKRREAILTSAKSMGLIVSSSTLVSILNSCSTGNEGDGWKPSLLSEEQFKVVGNISEIIIPKTEVPGANDLMIDRFIDMMINEVFAPEDQGQFLSGCNDFMASNPDFAKKPTTETIAKLNTSKGDQNINIFYKKLKQLTILGFTQSEHIGEQVMSYDPIPGEYNGCIPYDGSNAWSLI
ncbi:MAG: gluconate 2-dehydrogenase subunit 3 family protein [Cyclobacteriaceae bacterium]